MNTEISELAQKLGHIGQTVLKLILKSPKLVSFDDNLTPFQPKSAIRAEQKAYGILR